MFNFTLSAASKFKTVFKRLMRFSVISFVNLNELSKNSELSTDNDSMAFITAMVSFLIRALVWIVGAPIALCLTAITLPLALVGAIFTAIAAVFTLPITAMIDVAKKCFGKASIDLENISEKSSLKSQETLVRLGSTYEKINEEMPLNSDVSSSDQASSQRLVLYNEDQAELAAKWIEKVLSQRIPSLYLDNTLEETYKQISLVGATEGSINKLVSSLLIIEFKKAIWNELKDNYSLNVKHIGMDFFFRVGFDSTCVINSLRKVGLNIKPTDRQSINGDIFVHIHQSGRVTYQLDNVLGDCKDYLDGIESKVSLASDVSTPSQDDSSIRSTFS